ncbi:hypothetical protein OEZ85_011547 [Tetradesmus obliquus]|uniref:6-phosphogluconolactonase n=1 Tax=Tetradesmus obliquus TaxID=3088 RepID=A0ABY8TQS6_TETOB|nr:hypothetical protein OEZ85_011547 [Tetradesmus obliquus]
MAWSSSDSSTSPVRNIVIANHAGNNGEAITSMQLYPPYAKRSASVRTDDPCHIGLHPSGRWAATASYDAGTIGIVELLPAPQAAAVEVSRTSPAAAMLLDEQQQQQQQQEGVFLPAELQLSSVTTYPTELVGEAAHEAKFSHDGTLLYVPCLKSDWVRMFKFDAETGKLTPHSYPAAAAAGPGHPSGQEPDRIVSMLPPGTSAEPVCVKYGMTVVAGSNPPGDIACTELCRPYGGAELALSNDGRFLYASNRGLCEGTPAAGKSSIVAFAVDQASGALTALDWKFGGGDVQHPRHFSLTPDEANAFLLVANMHGESVTVFRRDASSGLLSKVSTVSTADSTVVQPAFVAVI